MKSVKTVYAILLIVVLLSAGQSQGESIVTSLPTVDGTSDEIESTLENSNSSEIFPDNFDEPLIAVCHVSKDSPFDSKSVTVSLRSLKDHFKHGDLLGPCS